MRARVKWLLKHCDKSEVILVIDEEKTFREKGYYSTDLKQMSGKHVYAICEGESCQREGGRGRWVRKCDYTILCHRCSMNVHCREKNKDKVEKRECIDDDITFAEKGYRSTELKHGSNKEVWRVCLGCGEGRWLRFQHCNDLCHKCAIKNKPMEKCETPTEKLPWVDDDITFAEKGYRSTELKPGSGKIVWAVCANMDCKREAGRGRWVKFRQCHEMCHLCANRTVEYRNKRREIQKTKTGESNQNWRGGTSFEPYCEKFNKEFKESVRDKFGRVCFMCNKTENDNGRKLDVHHVNYDKECLCDGADCEFVPLCIKCHRKTNGSRDLWERLIMNVLYYEVWI